MNCEEVESVLIDYLDNTLDKTKRKEIDNHILSCEECMSKISDTQTIMQSIADSEMKIPDHKLRMEFYKMLQTETDNIKAKDEIGVKTKTLYQRFPTLFRIAASIALLIAGSFIGYNFYKSSTVNNSTAQLNELRNEVNDIKKMLLFTMSKEDSPSQRIKAVSIEDESLIPDQKVLDILINALNNDNNINVRMAAAYSLSKYLDIPQVCDSIVESLGKQTEPIIQVVLMNILTEKKELRAVEPMKKIISNKNTLEQVKDAAQKSINILL